MSRPAPKKSIKLISHFKKDPRNKKFEPVKVKEEVLNDTANSIEVIDGSFSELKPIGFSKKQETFIPLYSSTPKYEDITDEDEICADSDSGPEEIEENDDDHNVTFNFEDDIMTQNKITEVFVKKVETFLLESETMVKSKVAKRNELFKKINKYKRKLNKLEKAVSDLDKYIYYGQRLPRLMELPK